MGAPGSRLDAVTARRCCLVGGLLRAEACLACLSAWGPAAFSRGRTRGIHTMQACRDAHAAAPRMSRQVVASASSCQSVAHAGTPLEYLRSPCSLPGQQSWSAARAIARVGQSCSQTVI